jgi:hypothetical protein
MGIEVACVHDIPHLGNGMIRWDGDVAGGHQLVAVEQAETDAALLVASGDYERRAFDKLELQLRPAGVGAARTVWRIDIFEDDALAV